MESLPEVRIRSARTSDRNFILDLAERFVAFDLPPWRDHDESRNRRATATSSATCATAPKPRTSSSPKPTTARRAGFLHVQSTIDFFTGAPNCHISDIAVAPASTATVSAAASCHSPKRSPKTDGCRFVTLSVFPANARARALYERHGYGVELVRMAKAVR